MALPFVVRVSPEGAIGDAAHRLAAVARPARRRGRVGVAGADRGRLMRLHTAILPEGDIHARERTEGPCKPGRNGTDFSAAGEEGSQRHACGVRLRAHTRGAAFGRGPQASDSRDERRATRPYACQWPPRAYRHPADPTCRPDLARVGSGQTGTTRRLTVAGVCNVQRTRKI